MAKTAEISVEDIAIRATKIDGEDYICITDIARKKNSNAPADIIKNWLRNKNTIELLGLREKLNNPKFKLVDFDQFRNEAGYNHFAAFPHR